MEWLAVIIGGVATLAAALWGLYRSAFRAGASEQRAEVERSLAAAGKRRSRWEQEQDEKIERDRLAAIEAARASVTERKAEAAVDIDAAEAALRKRTEEPWEP